ncbi:TPR-like protein [Boletus edulis]|nr:TPR-like protein [Boletus edulis]
MTSRFDTEGKRSQSESETSGSPDEGYGNTGDKHQLELRTSPYSNLPKSIQTTGVPNACAGELGMQDVEETSGPGNWPQHVPSCSRSTTVADENEETMITSIRATNVTVGLRRLPAGFYTVVNHSGLEWRTENKRSSVNDGVVEWSGPIPIPSDLSATIYLEVYASFEFQPMLGAGEQLRELAITVVQLLDCSAKDIPFTLFPKDGDIVSPCSSILVTVRRGRKISDLSASRDLGPRGSTTEPQGELEDATNQGHSALSRYRKHGGKRDLQRSIEGFQRALNSCPLEHPCRAAAQANLAMAKFIFCQVEDAYVSLDVPLQLYCNALAARPVGHFDRPSTLIQLAAVHFAVFERGKDAVEQAQTEALLHEAMEFSSTESHENQAAALMLQLYAGRKVQVDGELSVEQDLTSRLTDEDLRILSSRLLGCFERSGDLADLQQAIAIEEKLVRSTPVWDDRYRTGLVNLGLALLHRFKRLGELSDLEDAISRMKHAVDLTPNGHPDKQVLVTNLGTCFSNRFLRLEELRDLEDAISMHRDAVELTPHGHYYKYGFLGNLGNCFRAQLSDLEDAISRYRDAADLIPHGHPDKPHCLSNLGRSFFVRFERLYELGDLENATSMLRDAIDLTPDGHPDKPALYSSLASCFRARFERFGELSNLEEAVSRYKDAVDLTPDGHPDKPIRLNDLGTSISTRFERLGELSDLEVAISLHRDAVNLAPRGHPDKRICLHNLGDSLGVRYERLGKLSDLEDAISILRDAVDLIPPGHPEKSAILNSLGISFDTRYWRLGELGDLDGAISTLRDAVDLTPCGHPKKPAYLSNLGTSFRARFQHLGELSDLEAAILTQKNSVDLAPHGHPSKPAYLNSLGNSFTARFERLRELSDLEHAISTHKDALNLTPHGHPQKPVRLNSLAKSLRARFKHLGELGDLEEAISMLREAIDHLPHGHPDKPTCLNDLGSSLQTRFQRLGELSDLENAISMLRDAIDLTPQGHPAEPSYLNNLANSLFLRFERYKELRDLEKAISLYSDAASAPFGPTRDRFHASQIWIKCAQLIRHSSLFHAYSAAITLLPQLAWVGLSLTRRYSALRHEAAATALDLGFPETAVEWLEQGRSIVWGDLLQLRSSYEDLTSAHPDHARRLRRLSSALEHASATHERSLSALSEQTYNPVQIARESLQQEADKHRALAIERDRLLQEIRSLPGFERFLLHKEFSQLRRSAHSGPIIILNAAESRCDALIVLADVDHVIHSLLGHAREVIPCDDRKGSPTTRRGVSWESLLSNLWNGVVKLVLDALAFSIPGGLSRIFWCPTGPFVFLPIHAAGLYDTQHSLPGYKVILAPSPNPSAEPSGDLRLLTVRQPSSDGLSRLPGVHKELEHIKDVLRNSPSARTTLMESSLGTVEEVLGMMREADWVHFACHGIQDAASPTESGLCLADGRKLKITDMLGLSRSRGGLAFLSACQTAMGDEDLTDEAIHIAAGMLFAGYGGVVGTMWSISDKLAPYVARNVYEQLFRNGARPDYREAARALHEAIGRLRASGEASFATWLPFIHVGL